VNDKAIVKERPAQRKQNEEITMFATLKALPILPKIILGSLLVLGIYGLTHRHHPAPHDFNGPVEPEEATGDDAHATHPSHTHPAHAQLTADNEAEMAQQYLSRFKQQQVQVQGRAQACMAQMQQATNQMAQAAMNGQMYSARPACEQEMAQLTAQEAYLETVIYQLQTGDVHATMQQITGVQIGSNSNAPSYYRPSGPGNDGGLSAVENYDRQGVRGTSLYNEEDGAQHELPTAPYYFRDRETGQFVSSQQSTPPNDGHDYDPLTARQ
jgi:hypothetical protein